MMRRITMTACVAIAAAFAYADPATGWKMTGAGPYRYADPENWVDGEVNGVFGSDLALVASLGAGRSSQEGDCPRMDPRRRTWALRTRSVATRCGSSALRARSTALATLRTGLVGASWKATWPIHAAHTRIMRG